MKGPSQGLEFALQGHSCFFVEWTLPNSRRTNDMAFLVLLYVAASGYSVGLSDRGGIYQYSQSPDGCLCRITWHLTWQAEYAKDRLGAKAEHQAVMTAGKYSDLVFKVALHPRNNQAVSVKFNSL